MAKSLSQEIKDQYKGLLTLCKPFKNAEEIRQVKKAFDIANKACKESDNTLSGEILKHSLSIATLIIKDLGLGVPSVVASLLFPVAENNLCDIACINKEFDAKIASMVEGLIKISEIQTQKQVSQAENFRSLLLTLARDVRVILIKIVDQLYSMRSMDIKDNGSEKIKLASDAFFLYAPLAHRLGLYRIKSELEDLAMKFTEYDQYKYIAKRLKDTAAARNTFIRNFIKPVADKLKKEGFLFEITGRPKSIYSIWRKMKNQNVDFDEVYDKFAIRIILKSHIKTEKADCWRVFSIITETYQPNPNRLRDWISVPKSNGYESLHTTVVVPGGIWVEVQIRTERMDEIAEKGLAAHWKYKDVRDKKSMGIDEWLDKFREILEEPDTGAEDIIDDFKLSLYSKEIFIFTPKGDLKKFPENATVLDFAYDIHSDIGNTCAGAKVNGKTVPIRHKLVNGDKVEIFTSKNQKPRQDWLDFVVTSKAKSKIKHTLKEQILNEAEHGKEIIKRRLRNWKIKFSDENVRKLMKHFKLNTATELYYNIATEKIDLSKIKDVLLPGPDIIQSQKNEATLEEQLDTKDPETYFKTDDYLVIDEKLHHIDYKLGKCCNPVFGDEIFGFVSVGEGIKIHRINCPNAIQLISKYGYRVVKAKWKESKSTGSYITSIRITGINDAHIFSRISEVISKDLRITLQSINMDNNEGLFEGIIRIYIKNINHLEDLIKRLSQIKGVLSVSRNEN